MATDKIILEGMTFYGYHGVSAAEKELGQRFVVDLEACADLSAAGRTDDLALTVNYAALYQQTKEIVEGPSCNLLECVAERIASTVLAAHPVEEVRVKVRKPGAPIKGSVLISAAVEIVRRRSPG
jgi:dihydroneopterin aldolase